MLSGRRVRAPARRGLAAPLPLPADVPARLRELLARLLSPVPRDRPAGAGEVERELGRFVPWLAGRRRRLVRRLLAGAVDIRAEREEVRALPAGGARAAAPPGPGRRPARAVRSARPWLSSLLPAWPRRAGCSRRLLAGPGHDGCCCCSGRSPRPSARSVLVARGPAPAPAPSPAAIAPPAPPPPEPVTAGEPADLPTVPPPRGRRATAPAPSSHSPRAPAARRRPRRARAVKTSSQGAEVRFQWRDFDGAERMVRAGDAGDA